MVMRGHIDTCAHGKHFTMLAGWVVNEDGTSAATPLQIVINGEKFGPIFLEPRGDLNAAGVALGPAAFQVLLKNQLTAGTLQAIEIVDSKGDGITLPIEENSVAPLIPRGIIENVEPEFISGWIVDPDGSKADQSATILRDGTFFCNVKLSYDRPDLQLQCFGGSTAFGFRAAPDNLSSIFDRNRKVDIILTLVSSGRHLSEIVIRPISAVLDDERSPDTRAVSDVRPKTEPSPKRNAAKASTVPPKALSTQRPDTAIKPSGKPRMTVISWDMSHNPVGRAFLLADMARSHFDVELLGPIFAQYGSGLWEPLQSEESIKITTFEGGNLSRYVQKCAEIAENHPAEYVYVSKPRLPSLLLGIMIKLLWQATLLVDVDDHELSFFPNHSEADLEEALRLASGNPDAAQMPYSEVWTRLGEWLLRYADGVTVSNIALRERFGGVIVRHARNEATFNVTAARRAAVRRELGVSDDEVAVMFMGTPRPHKGIYEIAEAVNTINDRRLIFIIIGSITDKSVVKKLNSYSNARIKLLPNQSWSRLHEFVAAADIVPIIQDVKSAISEFQIPAKLTDAMALQVPVLATQVPPLSDLQLHRPFISINAEVLEGALRSRLENPDVFQAVVRNARSLYLMEFTYSVNAHRIRLAALEAKRSYSTKTELAAVRDRIVAFARGGETQEIKEQPRPSINRKKFDLIFFWKQNDSDIYGRRPDMMVKYLLETDRVKQILHLDRPLNTTELIETVDHGPLSKFHEGNLVYMNTARRALSFADRPRLAKRTFLYRQGAMPQNFLGRDLPTVDGYPDFIREILRERGMDPHPISWVCPVVFDYPRLHSEIAFGLSIVDIVDDQRKFPAKPAYMSKVVQSYIDTLALGDIVISNCDAVREGFRELRDDIAVVANGAEVFPKDHVVRPPADLTVLPRPWIGYVGNLRDRFDVELVRKMALRHPDWSIVLIGSARGAVDVIALGKLDNVTLLGVRAYDEALRYIKNFDVAIMPHLHNELSSNMNPLKLYVYLALDVSIVTSRVDNISDVAPFADVADGDDDFIMRVENAVKVGRVTRSHESEKARNDALERMSWRSRIARIFSLIDG